MKQKDLFSHLDIILVALILLTIGGYLFINKNSEIAQSNKLNPQQSEIEELKKSIEDLKNQKPKAIDLSINSSDVGGYLSGVSLILCGFPDKSTQSGSASLWHIGNDYLVLTNKHVISGNPSDCIMQVEDKIDSQSAAYRLDIKNILSWNSLTDSSALRMTDMIYPSSAPIADLNYSISNLRKCDVKMAIGSPVIVIGYPAFAQIPARGSNSIFQTVTNGILSGYDTSVSNKNLPYNNYFISAKMDSGNSGGIVLSKDNQGMCVLGLPTWLSLGNYETQGIVQNIHNVLFSD